MRGLTTSCPIDDERRFNLGTPKEAWRTMTRCCEIKPTSERIIADIIYFPNVLKIFRDHEGAFVPEMNFRHGQQAQAINGGRVVKHKINRRQRKHLLTMGPIHPNAQEADLINMFTVAMGSDVLLAQNYKLIGFERGIMMRLD